MATAPIKSEAVSAENTWAPAAVWNTTNANSPPCPSNSVNTGRSCTGSPIQRDRPKITASFSVRKATTTTAIGPGDFISTPKSMLMPTAMKNRPSSRPLKGSMSVSSSRRYSLSASSTPARKAPSAMDKPTSCIRPAMPTTSSKEAAVKISGVLLRAIQRNSGRNSRRPPRMTPAMAAAILRASKA